MSNLTNLIDFIDDETICKSNFSNNTLQPPLISSPIAQPTSSSGDNEKQLSEKRILNPLEFLLRGDSLENNPFDKLHKQVELYDDPFEIVLRNNNVNLSKKKEGVDVPTDNLINIDNNIDAIINENNKKNIKRVQSDSDIIPKLNEVEKLRTNSLDQITICKKPNLLKMSIANASLELQSVSSKNLETDTNYLKDSLFLEANKLAKKLSNLSIRSPSGSGDNDSSTDDLMSTKPNWIDSETDVDSDYEQMKIPFLKTFNNNQMSAKKTLSTNESESIDDDQNNIIEKFVKHKNNANVDTREIIQLQETHLTTQSSDYNNDINSNNNNIDLLLNKVKNAVQQCDDMEKQTTAQKLLNDLNEFLNNESLKSPDPQTPSDGEVTIAANSPQPKPIKREGTFDIDKSTSINDENSSPSISSSSSQSITKPELNNDEISNIINKIGSALGNNNLSNNINIIQSNNLNCSTGNNGSNIQPTYIVIMGTPSSTATINQLSDNFQNNSFRSRLRSHSVSLHDKPSIVEQQKISNRDQNSSNYNYIKNRRSSFSTTVNTTNEKLTIHSQRRTSISSTTTTCKTNNNFTSPKRLSTQFTSSNNSSSSQYAKTPKKSLMETKRPQFKPINTITPSKLQKIRVRAQPELCGLAKKGPIKAIPTQLKNKITSSSTATNKSTSRYLSPNDIQFSLITSTPIHSKSLSSSGKLSVCSTPISSKNIHHQQQPSLLSMATPVTSKTHRSRLSFISATPNAKPMSNNMKSLASASRRRTLSELNGLENQQQQKVKHQQFGNNNNDNQKSDFIGKISNNKLVVNQIKTRLQGILKNKENKSPTKH